MRQIIKRLGADGQIPRPGLLPLNLCACLSHRIRFIGITAVSIIKLRLLDSTTVVTWRLTAKDGQDLPARQQILTPGAARLGAGETMDVEFTPPHPGTFTLEVSALYNVPRWTRLSVIADSSAASATGSSRAGRLGSARSS